jgi:DNA modification methylase
LDKVQSSFPVDESAHLNPKEWSFSMSGLTTIKSTHSLLSRDNSLNHFANDVAIEICDLNDLKIPEKQLRPPTQRAISTAKAILLKWTQLVPVIIDSTGVIVAGQEFLEAARVLDWKTIKAIRLEAMTVADRRCLTIALQRLPELSAWDDVALAAELKDLLDLTLDFDVGDITGFTVGELDVIVEGASPGDQPDALDVMPDETSSAPVTQQGDIWVLGGHRILCGDALDPANVTALMAGSKANMVITDPPYGIAIKGHVSQKHEDFQMGVGEQTRDEFKTFLSMSLANLLPSLLSGSLVYSFMDRRHLLELQMAAEAAGLILFDLAIWNKGSGGMGSFYRSQHEPCMIFKYGSAPHRNNIELGRHGRNRTNVWDQRGLSSFGKGRSKALASHPTVKPVALLAEAIKDCTKKGDIIVDPFVGSGSTILSAEKTGRRAFGIELEPKYTDVAVLRWQAMTGREAVLKASGETFKQVMSRRIGNIANPSTARAPESPLLMH